MDAVREKTQHHTNVISGFGYALMDLFENDNINMDFVVRQEPVEDVESPFVKSRSKSPKRSPKRMSKEEKDEYRKKRREEKKREQEEKERREKAPAFQYHLLKVKTSVGRYPVLNFSSPFTNDEIKSARRCQLNGWRKPED